jgi:hypothetical protein
MERYRIIPDRQRGAPIPSRNRAARNGNSTESRPAPLIDTAQIFERDNAIGYISVV